MSKYLKIAALLLFVNLHPVSSKAQFNVGPEFVFPVAGFGEHVRWGYGAGFLIEIPVFKPVSLVGHFDYIHWVINEGMENLRLNQVALQAGVRLYPSRKVYIQAWGGGFEIYAARKIYGIEANGSDSEYGWAVGGGFLPNTRTDLGLCLQSMGPLRYLALRLDYRLGLPAKPKTDR